MGLDGYVGSFETQLLTQKLQLKQEQILQQNKNDLQKSGFNNKSSLLLFQASQMQEEEKQIQNESVGLLTREEYAKTQEVVRQKLEEELKRDELLKKEKRERRKQREQKRQRKRKDLLSFACDEDCEEDCEEEEEGNEEEGWAKKKEKKKQKIGLNPDALIEHVPNGKIEIEKEEVILRERLREEFLEKKRKQMEEDIAISFSYWSGGGGRRKVLVKQKDTVREFLKRAMNNLKDEFRELKSISVEQMMYVKEDCIIPHEMTFYELISRKARGKSGPLFRFDAQEDVRVLNDATKEKEDSHPGKIFHRSWYDKNKHIFPASRWEVFDFSKDFSNSYTIHGYGGEQQKPWER